LSVGIPAIFDGHNDVLSRLWRAGNEKACALFRNGRDGAIDLPKSRTGGFAGGFFAIYVPSPDNRDFNFEAMNQPEYDLPLPDPIPVAESLPVALAQASILHRLEADGALKICTNVAEIRSCMASQTIAAIMHIEGADCIDPDFHVLDLFYRAGLRSLGPVWSRPTLYGHGVPFRFPSDGNIGPGLTDDGIRLVKRCNDMGIIIDLSHLNEAGFWDVAKHSTAPLIATHSNATTLCRNSRNLTDRQLDAIAESDGMVGINFAVAFLRTDGQKDINVELDDMMRHFDHLIGRLGEDRVGLGSDYDGAEVPLSITDVSQLDALRNAFRTHGYNEQLLTKLCHENWLSALERSWGSGQLDQTIDH